MMQAFYVCALTPQLASRKILPTPVVAHAIVHSMMYCMCWCGDGAGSSCVCVTGFPTAPSPSSLQRLPPSERTALLVLSSRGCLFNLSNSCSPPFLPRACEFSERWGLYGGVTAGAVMNLACALLHYIGALLPGDAMGGHGRYAVTLIGQIMGALGQPCFTNAPAKMAGVWFPASEREIATTIAAMLNPIGACACACACTCACVCCVRFGDAIYSHLHTEFARSSSREYCGGLCAVGAVLCALIAASGSTVGMRVYLCAC
jgi:hypothetical protein